MNATLTDGSILREFGVTLQRNESVAQPVPVATSVWVCAWCQRERNEPPQVNQSHGICARHSAEMQADIKQRRS